MMDQLAFWIGWTVIVLSSVAGFIGIVVFLLDRIWRFCQLSKHFVDYCRFLRQKELKKGLDKSSFYTTIEDKHLIPFYFPLTEKLIYVNPKFFNGKWAGYPKSSDENIRCFRVLTLDEAKEIEKRLDK